MLWIITANMLEYGGTAWPHTRTVASPLGSTSVSVMGSQIRARKASELVHNRQAAVDLHPACYRSDDSLRLPNDLTCGQKGL